MSREKKPLTHGTPHGYKHYGCRCDECSAAYNELGRKYYQANRVRVLERQRGYYRANSKLVAKRQQRYYQANRERIAERSREYYQAHRESVAERSRIAWIEKRAYWDEYRAANRDYILERDREYNKRRTETYKLRWSEQDPYGNLAPKTCNVCKEELPRTAFYTNVARSDGLQQRCRVCNMAPTVARFAELREFLWARDGGVCYICSQPADPDKWHIDHIHPKLYGGSDDLENLAVTHPPCNIAKGAKLGYERTSRAQPEANRCSRERPSEAVVDADD